MTPGDGDARETLKIDTEHAVPADLKIEVLDRAKDDQTFAVKVTSPWLNGGKPIEDEWKLERKSGEVVTGFMAEFTAKGADAPSRLLALRGAGRNLWKAAPDCFTQSYWELVDGGHPPETLLIVSEERSIPWELMIPMRPGTKNPKPLGVLASVARWFDTAELRSPGSPLADARVVVGKSTEAPPLTSAGAESAMVVKGIGGSELPKATAPDLEATITHWGGTLLHFICHGQNTVPQTLLLDGRSKLTATQVDGMFALPESWSQTTPLVFLNACEVGSAAPTLAGTGGFARSWADAGAGAVIAPLWSVGDARAHDVAKRFYEAVVNDPKTPYARIMRDIRALAYEDEGGVDTYAAYCYFGSPTAAMQMGTVSASG